VQSKIKKYFEQFLLSALMGGLSMGVTYLAKLSNNVEQMTIAIQLLAEKLSNIDKLAQDHESRLRSLEKRR
jgi:formate/nitrite transporter FocA (FNT family)